MQYEYFYGAQAEQFSFYRIPKALFTEPKFRELSTDAKVLYGILLDRMSLSLKNQWLDAQNKVYIIFTVEEIMDALNCANQKAIRQSMNSAGGRCHDNARCESMWARMKTELLYDRYDSEQLTVEQLKSLVWRYFMSYWNNRRICSANGGLPPMVKRSRFYAAQAMAA